MTTTFIELQRRFAEYQADGTPEALAQRSYLIGFMGREQGVTWPELLKHRLVFILGEPGSGKTSELRAQQQSQSANSFFLALNRLVWENVSDTLDDEGSRRFNEWKNGRGEITFFLDSIDESKILRIDDFFTALDRVKKAIGPAMPRARFVILANLGWTVKTLTERLENQLVGQYLRPANIRHGIYVLGNTEPKRHWEMPDSGKRINFQELVSLLQDRAKALQAEQRSHVDGIEVIGIDFSDPRQR